MKMKQLRFLKLIVSIVLPVILLMSCPGSSGTDKTKDTTQLSVQLDLSCSASSTSEILCSWSVSGDTNDVAGYFIYSPSVQIGTSGTTSYNHDALTAGRQYCYTIKAHDASGVLSAASGEACATTASVAVPDSLVGKWGFVRIRHMSDGQWTSSVGEITYNNDGTGSLSARHKKSDSGAIETEDENFTYTAVANADSSITITGNFPDGIKIHRHVISDTGEIMFREGTDSDRQSLRVFLKLDPDTAYTNLFLANEYYGMEYRYDNEGYHAESSIIRFDGSGEAAGTVSANSNGVISTRSYSYTYEVSPDGTVRHGNLEGYVSASGMLSVSANIAETGDYSVRVNLKQGDRLYSTGDLEGTWLFMGFGEHDISDLIYRSEFGSMTCDALGDCNFSIQIMRSDSSFSNVTATASLAVAVDGSFGGSLSAGAPSYAGAIGNDGNTIIINMSTDFNDANTDDRAIAIAVKCGSCSNLLHLTRLTTSSRNDTHAFWSPDGTQIAFESDDDVWVMDADGSNQTQLTTDDSRDTHPYWSPGGTQIAFQSDRAGTY